MLHFAAPRANLVSSRIMAVSYRFLHIANFLLASNSHASKAVTTVQLNLGLLEGPGLEICYTVALTD